RVTPATLHPFPTRRSSDLGPNGQTRGDPGTQSHGTPERGVGRAAEGAGDPWPSGMATAGFANPKPVPAGGHAVTMGARHACETSDRKSTRLNSSHEWISYA